MDDKDKKLQREIHTQIQRRYREAYRLLLELNEKGLLDVDAEYVPIIKELLAKPPPSAAVIREQEKRERAWNDKFESFKEYESKNSNARLSSNPLHVWGLSQRTAYSAGKLSESRLLKLRSVESWRIFENKHRGQTSSK